MGCKHPTAGHGIITATGIYTTRGTELNAASGWYETLFRGYDAALGRFLQVDALAASYSDWTPYGYANDNPIKFNDPTGLSADDDYEVAQIYIWMNRYGGSWSERDGLTLYNSAWEASYARNEYIDRFGGFGGGGYGDNGYWGNKIEVYWDGKAAVVKEKRIWIATGPQTRGDGSWINDTWDWMKDHFEISGGYEFSVGWQIGGGWKKNLAAYVDFGSSVHSDLNLSNKGSTGKKYELNEKKNYGFGGAYKFVGVDFKRQEFNGQIINTVSVGALGIFAGERSFNDKGELTDWFWGIDVSVKAAMIFGIEGGFKLGFSK